MKKRRRTRGKKWNLGGQMNRLKQGVITERRAAGDGWGKGVRGNLWRAGTRGERIEMRSRIEKEN